MWNETPLSESEPCVYKRKGWNTEALLRHRVQSLGFLRSGFSSLRYIMFTARFAWNVPRCSSVAYYLTSSRKWISSHLVASFWAPFRSVFFPLFRQGRLFLGAIHILEAFWSASSLSCVYVTSNQRCCSVTRVTLCVCLAHPFSADGTAKSHVVTLFLWCLPSPGSHHQYKYKASYLCSFSTLGLYGDIQREYLWISLLLFVVIQKLSAPDMSFWNTDNHIVYDYVW